MNKTEEEGGGGGENPLYEAARSLKIDFLSFKKKLGSQWSMYGPEIAHKIVSGVYEET